MKKEIDQHLSFSYCLMQEKNHFWTLILKNNSLQESKRKKIMPEWNLLEKSSMFAGIQRKVFFYYELLKSGKIFTAL